MNAFTAKRILITVGVFLVGGLLLLVVRAIGGREIWGASS